MSQSKFLSRKAFLRLGAGGAIMAAMTSSARQGRAGDNKDVPMHTRSIPSSGEAIPVIGLGTWQAFDVGSGAAERARLGQVLDTLFQAGGRMIDSSPMYGQAEQVVGDLLSARTDGIDPFLATKVWTRGREDGVRQMDRSTARMQGQVDLMQVHNLLDWRTHLDTLRGWKADGKIRYVGVTHYTNRALDDVADLIETEDLDFVQIAYSVTVREAEQRLLPVAAEKGTAVIVNRPFEGGGVFRALRQQPLPPWAAELDCESWGQVLLKYLLGHPAVTCLIPGTGNPDHMRDNCRAGTGILPDSAARRRIEHFVDRL
jgi:diketogulonate reductase-like aldo/keto reductase